MEAIIDHPHVKAISFVGSTKVWSHLFPLFFSSSFFSPWPLLSLFLVF